MKNVLSFIKLHKKSAIISSIVFVLALVVFITCFVCIKTPSSTKPTEDLSVAETITPNNTGFWTGWGKYATSFAGGTGKETDPYLISTPQQLAKLAKDVNGGNKYSGKYFKLTNDINLLDYYWTPIGDGSKYFSGCFDGAGHEISGMVIDGDYRYAGLFGYMKCTSSDIPLVIKDLGIVNSSVNTTFSTSSNSKSVGGLIGEFKFETPLSLCIENCYSETTVNALDTAAVSSVGGLVGVIQFYCSSSTLGQSDPINIKFINCYNAGSVSGDEDIGGLVGKIYSRLSYTISSYSPINVELIDCYNAGNVTGSNSTTRASNVGGLVGIIESVASSSVSSSPLNVKITNCYNTGNINCSSVYRNYTSGLVGYVDHRHSTSSLTSYESSLDLSFKNSFNTGDLTCSSSNGSCRAGGLLGDSYFVVSTSTSISVTSSYDISFEGCYNTGNQIGSSATAGGCIGGLFGYFYHTNTSTDVNVSFNNCFNDGDITNLNTDVGRYIGGIIAYFRGQESILNINQCFYKGTITSSATSYSLSNPIGGLIGYLYCSAQSTIQNCFVDADVIVEGMSIADDDFSYGDKLIGNKSSTYTATLSNYYYDFSRKSSSSTVELKEYSGEFNPTIWFFHEKINDGNPTLKLIYWIGRVITSTDDIIISQLTSKGFSEVA